MKRTLSVACAWISLVMSTAVTELRAESIEQPAGEETAADSQSAREELYEVPVSDKGHVLAHLKTRICRPPDDHVATMVVIAHGSPPDPADRPHMKLIGCDAEAVRWFLSRGYAVALSLRRGYGATGGEWAEGYGNCRNPDYLAAGVETARDIDAVVEFASSLPRIRPTGMIVVGQSAGGWGAIAYSGVSHPRVGGFVIMAGGRGGHEHDRPNQNCRPDRLSQASAILGAHFRTPMLWIYARNDIFFAPSVAEAMWNAFKRAGGIAVLNQPTSYDGDGHRLFFGENGSQIWGPVVSQYLADIEKPSTAQ